MVSPDVVAREHREAFLKRWRPSCHCPLEIRLEARKVTCGKCGAPISPIPVVPPCP